MSLRSNHAALENHRKQTSWADNGRRFHLSQRRSPLCKILFIFFWLAGFRYVRPFPFPLSAPGPDKSPFGELPLGHFCWYFFFSGKQNTRDTDKRKTGSFTAERWEKHYWSTVSCVDSNRSSPSRRSSWTRSYGMTDGRLSRGNTFHFRRTHLTVLVCY